MAMRNFFSLDTSILYRATQRYFDETLADYGIGYAHLIFLIEIYENEGISMNSLADNGYFDKGTVTKSLQKLAELDYVEIKTNDSDRRAKALFTTAKTQEIILNLYEIRQERWNYLCQDFSLEDRERYIDMTASLAKKAKEYEKIKDESVQVKFYGLQKCTLLDYPGFVASTIFTGGCNFRCPYCHNRDLVFLDENQQSLDSDYLLDFFTKRKDILDGVCISGGEVLLSNGLKPFLRKLKNMGYLIKLDTNGSFFEKMKDLVEEGLIDYIAMDIKNSKEKYPITVGLNNLNLYDIEQSVNYLLADNVDYEFRTTLVQEFHDLDDLLAIKDWINGAKKYYLQNFCDSPKCIKAGLHPFTNDKMHEFKNALLPYIPNVKIRGEE